MANSTRTIDVLLKEVFDPALRVQLADAVNALRKQTRFGLVFEKHHPEVSRLPEVTVRKGSLVARRNEKGNVLYRVENITKGKALCLPEEVPAEAGDDLFAHALTIPVVDLVVARRFGDPIYPSLRLVDVVERAPEKPWNILIQADNYHALQALSYTHAGKVDVIYIDPPYNTGAKDWRYNNDYVDGNDPWRHSKWLSFIDKRLRLARKLLKPNGVLVVTVDEHEVYHLGCLLEQVFPEAYRQMVTIVINEKGVPQERFSRAEEYAIFNFFGDAGVDPQTDDLLSADRRESKRFRTPRWEWLLRGGPGSKRSESPKLFYPVFIDPATKAIKGVGDAPPLGKDPVLTDDQAVAWPIRKDGSQGRWRASGDTLMKWVKQGYVKLGGWHAKRKTWTILYLGKKAQTEIKKGIIVIVGRDKKSGAVSVEYAETQQRQIKTVWHRRRHEAGIYGSNLLASVLGAGSLFPYPKSVYSVRDTLLALVRENKSAVVMDFFAGSGTTLHALALLNAGDAGQRQCILVTNNEVSADERQRLSRAGESEGDAKWEAQGICRAVTWPRCRYVIEGTRDGRPLVGENATGTFEEQEQPRTLTHLSFVEGRDLDLSQRRSVARLISGVTIRVISADTPWHLEEDGKVSILWDVKRASEWIGAMQENADIESLFVVTKEKAVFKQISNEVGESLPPFTTRREITLPMKDGFHENMACYELGFLDPGEVARGKQFAAILPLLWMLTGAKARCPKGGRINGWLLAPECGFAVLHNEERFEDFSVELKRYREIVHVFLVTDSEESFAEMRSGVRKSIQATMLYSSYLRNFSINSRVS